MRYIAAILIVLMSISICSADWSLVYAGPWIQTDAWNGQGTEPTYAEIYENSVLIEANWPLEPDLSIKYNLSQRPIGANSYVAKYCCETCNPLCSDFGPPILVTIEEITIRQYKGDDKKIIHEQH